MPHMLKLAKKQSFPEDFPKPRKFRETSRNDWIFKFRVQNQVPWQKVSGKNTQYIEISQNQPNLGQFGILGFWDSKVQKIQEVTKSTQNYPIYSLTCQTCPLFYPIFGLLKRTNFGQKSVFWKVREFRIYHELTDLKKVENWRFLINGWKIGCQNFGF